MDSLATMPIIQLIGKAHYWPNPPLAKQVSDQALSNTSMPQTAFGFGQINTELLEFSVEVGALESRLLRHPGHGAAFLHQVELKIRFLKRIPCFSEGLIELKHLLCATQGCARALRKATGPSSTRQDARTVRGTGTGLPLANLSGQRITPAHARSGVGGRARIR